MPLMFKSQYQLMIFNIHYLNIMLTSIFLFLFFFIRFVQLSAALYISYMVCRDFILYCIFHIFISCLILFWLIFIVLKLMVLCECVFFFFSFFPFGYVCSVPISSVSEAFYISIATRFRNEFLWLQLFVPSFHFLPNFIFHKQVENRNKGKYFRCWLLNPHIYVYVCLEILARKRNFHWNGKKREKLN